MKKRVLSLILTLVLCFCMAFSAFSADDDFVFTVDFSERYTDISEVEDEDYKNIIAGTASESAGSVTRRNIYIVVLSVLLVAAVVVLIVTLKRSRDEQAEDEAEDEAEALSNIRKVNLKKKSLDEVTEEAPNTKEPEIAEEQENPDKD